MVERLEGAEPGPDKLLTIIRIQTEVAQVGPDLEQVMNLVARRAQSLTGATGAAVELVEGSRMVYHAATGTASAQLGMGLERAGSLSGLCVDQGIALTCDDAETDPRVDREACRRVGLRSMIVVPLLHEGRALGVLKVLSAAPDAFNDSQVELLGLMAELIAAAMHHAR